MLELLATLDDWATSDPVMALATVVRTGGSTPRPPGARLLVSRDGRMVGSVSGGCLELAVIQEAQATLAGEAPPRILPYGISDELGWEVGLACGGTVDIFVETLRWDGSDPALVALREAATAQRPLALLTVLTGEHAGARAASDETARLVGDLGDPAVGMAATAAAASHLISGLPGVEDVVGVLCSSTRSFRHRGWSSSARCTSPSPSLGWPRPPGTGRWSSIRGGRS